MTGRDGHGGVGDQRAVSIPVNYVLLVGIVALLSMTLFTGVATFVDGQQQQAVHSGLEVAGNRLANDMTTVDRLAAGVGTGSVGLAVTLPESVAGQPYWIEIRATGTTGAYTTYEVVLWNTNDGVSVTVPVQTKRSLPTGETWAGGRLVVRYDASAAPGGLEVRDD